MNFLTRVFGRLDVCVILLALGTCRTLGAIPGEAPLAAPPATIQTPRPMPSEKESRTPAQQKLNSALLYEIYRRRGEAAQKGVPPGDTGVKIDKKGRALVDVRAEVSPALQKAVGALGSTIVSTSREYRSIIAWVPVLKLERLAANPTVRAIEPAAEATTLR